MLISVRLIQSEGFTGSRMLAGILIRRWLLGRGPFQNCDPGP